MRRRRRQRCGFDGGDLRGHLGPGDDGPGAGAAIFLGAGRGGCHTLTAAGSNGNVGPNLDEAKPDFQEAGARITNGGGGMPPFTGQLSEQNIRDVAAYVVKWNSGG